MKSFSFSQSSFKPTLIGYIKHPKMFYKNYLLIFKKFEDVLDFLQTIKPADYCQDFNVKQEVEDLKRQLSQARSLISKIRTADQSELGLDKKEMEFHEINVDKVLSYIVKIESQLSSFKFIATVDTNVKRDAMVLNGVKYEMEQARMRGRNVGTVILTGGIIIIKTCRQLKKFLGL